MNCTGCAKPIDKTRGYYLLKNAPYCIECHTSRVDASDIPMHPLQQAPGENLLEAFRAYQKQSDAVSRLP